MESTEGLGLSVQQYNALSALYFLPNVVPTTTLPLPNAPSLASSVYNLTNLLDFDILGLSSRSSEGNAIFCYIVFHTVTWTLPIDGLGHPITKFG